MSMMTVGDMRQHFLNVRNNASLRGDLNTLVEELTTGRASDLARHLGSGQTRLASADRQLELIDQFTRTNQETAQLLSAMQLALSSVETHRETTSNALLKINEVSTPAQIKTAASLSRTALDGTVQSLNMRFGDRTMFGGNDLDAAPLASAQSMLDDIALAVSGLTTADDIKIAVQAWFDTPAGGFETVGYLGSSAGHMEKPLDVNQSTQILVRADDASLRKVMTSLVLGSLAGDDTLSLNDEQRQKLLKDAGVDLLSAASPLTGLQADLGHIEGLVEDTSVRLLAQETSIEIARNDMVSVDPFETATQLEQVQLQLETHYTLTARLSRLSLMEYLR